MNHCRAIYVTGTDTGVGKTVISLSLIRSLQARGHVVLGMKPVASGCVASAEGWRNEDALALQAASSLAMPYHTINPCALPAATAPEIAAARAGAKVSLDPIIKAFRQLNGQSDWVVVEGVGGWLSPLSAELMQSDLVRRLRLPVILVVGVRLGCINHALLSLGALRADGVQLAGWIANAVAADLDFRDEYLQALIRRIDTPCLGVLSYGTTESAAIDIAPLLRAGEREHHLERGSYSDR